MMPGRASNGNFAVGERLDFYNDPWNISRLDDSTTFPKPTRRNWEPDKVVSNLALMSVCLLATMKGDQLSQRAITFNSLLHLRNKVKMTKH